MDGFLRSGTGRGGRGDRSPDGRCGSALQLMDAEGPLRPSLLSILGPPSFLTATCCRHALSHGLGEEQSGRCSCDILSKKGGTGDPGGALPGRRSK